MLGHATLHNQPFPGGKSTFTLPALITAHSYILYNMANPWAEQSGEWHGTNTPRAVEGKVVPQWTDGWEISLTFNSCRHSMHICSGNIVKEIEKPFCSSNAQSGPETKKQQRYPSSDTKERAALALEGGHFPLLRGMEQRDLHDTHMGLLAGSKEEDKPLPDNMQSEECFEGCLHNVFYITLLAEWQHRASVSSYRTAHGK